MPNILAIESSCDETAAAVIKQGKLQSNVISSQLQHSVYGGVIPELASRLHQQQIIRVVREAISSAKIHKRELDAVAFTSGPGLLGSLLVGTCFAKAFSFGLGIPLIDVNHMEAHVLANFIEPPTPSFPFLCLTVSGGHTQLVIVRDFLDMEIIGQTIDDAAGEAFDKAAKLLGLPYPGGPAVDQHAKQGDAQAFSFPIPSVKKFDYSFSGIKTSLLYLLQRNMKKNPSFISENLYDICASYQHHIVHTLLGKMKSAAQAYQITHLAIAGGVSANSLLRMRFEEMCHQHHWEAYIPSFAYCTDNAGMIAMAGHYKYLAGDFAELTVKPFTRASR